MKSVWLSGAASAGQAGAAGGERKLPFPSAIAFNRLSGSLPWTCAPNLYSQVAFGFALSVFCRPVPLAEGLKTDEVHRAGDLFAEVSSQPILFVVGRLAETRSDSFPEIPFLLFDRLAVGFVGEVGGDVTVNFLLSILHISELHLGAVLRRSRPCLLSRLA